MRRTRIWLLTGAGGLAFAGLVYAHEGQVAEGRMTGGGNFFCGDIKVTHGFELHCDPSVGPDNFELNYDGNQFHLTSVTGVECINDPAIAPPPPAAPFDTLILTGTGRFNGVDGAHIYLKMTDAGEPGTSDQITVAIDVPAGGTTVINCGPVNLSGGNQQAHTETPNRD
jgi:hypothetical protein